jgi:hypothetical protein
MAAPESAHPLARAARGPVVTAANSGTTESNRLRETDRGERERSGCRAPTPMPPVAEAIALYDRLLTSTELRTERQGPLPEGAGVRRARPHRRDHQTMERLIQRTRIPSTTTKCNSGGASTSAEAVPRSRGRLCGDHRLEPDSSYHEPRSTRLDALKQEFCEEALQSTWRCSTTRCRSATHSMDAATRTASAA